MNKRGKRKRWRKEGGEGFEAPGRLPRSNPWRGSTTSQNYRPGTFKLQKLILNYIFGDTPFGR